MKSSRFIAIAALALSAPLSAQPLVARTFPARVLAAQNALRTKVGLRPMVWDPQLGEAAALWAAHLATTNRFEHSDRKARPGIGENLWEGSHGRYSVEAMVSLWAAERSNFVPGIFPNVSRTSNWYDVSHYTQVIWPQTQRVGCALASNSTTDYLVCRYSPKGNVDGRKVP